MLQWLIIRKSSRNIWWITRWKHILERMPSEVHDLFFFFNTLFNYVIFCIDLFIPYTSGQGWKGKLNNLVIQLRKNCNHPDLLQGQIDGSCMSVSFKKRKKNFCHTVLSNCFISWQISTLLLKRLLDSVVNSAYWRDYLFGYLPIITKYVSQTHGS